MPVPLVSVILPVFNAESFLKQAIDSVLGQSVPLELIVIDDGSVDDSAAIAKSYGDRIRYIRQEHSGAAAARNRGIDAGSSEYLAFIDADDIWPDAKLSWQLESLEADKQAAVVIGQVMMFSEQRATAERHFSEPFFCYLFGSALLRRAEVLEIGIIDECLSSAEDLDWFLRMRENGVRIACIDRVALLYRRREASLTAGKNLIDRKVLLVLKQSLSRRRLKGGGKAPQMQDAVYIGERP